MRSFIEKNSKAILVGKYMAAYSAAKLAKEICKTAKTAVVREEADRPPMFSPEGSLEWHERNVACEKARLAAHVADKTRAEKFEKKLRYELLENEFSDRDIEEIRKLAI